MGTNTKIEWTNVTWNPWTGCRKVSSGCKYCYMYRGKDRYGQDPTKIIKSQQIRMPFSLKEPKLIFVCSWSDFFIREADEWREEAWGVIKRTPEHKYQILTKRPERIKKCLPADWGTGYDNVWLGISTEDQKNFIDRMERFDDINAKVKFISAEPLLDKIDITIFTSGGFIKHPGVDWVIIGGESGFNTGKYRYRKCEVSWIKKIVDDCRSYDIPVFVKQLGNYLGNKYQKKHADIRTFPQELKVREMPKILKYDLNFEFNEIK